MSQNVLSPLSLLQEGASGEVKLWKLEDAITATNTPVALKVAGAKRIGLIFTEAGTVNNRSGALVLTVSYDGGVTFVTYNMIIDNVTNTNAQTLTRIGSKTVNSASSVILFLSPETLGAMTHLKATITVTDGGSPTGNFSLVAAVQY